MKILITGATGFVGRYVVEEALRQGHSVIALARNKAKAKSFSWFEKVSFLEFDIEKDEACIQLMGNPDAVIHLAWSGLPNYRSLHHLEINLPSSMRFIRSIISGGIKNLLVTGTCFEFGMQNGALSPNMPTLPDNSYGIAKDTLRKWIEKLHDEYEFTHQWIRIFYVYGEGQSDKSILSKLKQALDKSETVFNMSGGEQIRDYSPIETVASKIIGYIQNSEHSATRHCCNGNPISIRNLVENYLKENGKNIELNLGYYPYPDYEPLAFWGIE